MRRAFLLMIIAACLLPATFLSGCGGKDESSNSTPGRLPGSSRPASDAPAAPPASELVGKTVTGTGDAETAEYMMSGVPLNLRIVHTGAGPGFEVVMVNSLTGVETPVVTGVAESSFKGSKVLSVQAGAYRFRVKASGPWTITVEQ